MYVGDVLFETQKATRNVTTGQKVTYLPKRCNAACNNNVGMQLKAEY